MPILPNMQMVWNSAKGYSLPNELVTVLAAKTGMVHILCNPAADDEVQVQSSYWIAESELTELPVQYYYRPIRLFKGAVLKCAGICSESNRDWFAASCIDEGVYLAGVTIVEGYRGDRIYARDFSCHTWK